MLRTAVYQTVPLATVIIGRLPTCTPEHWEKAEHSLDGIACEISVQPNQELEYTGFCSTDTRPEGAKSLNLQLPKGTRAFDMG